MKKPEIKEGKATDPEEKATEKEPLASPSTDKIKEKKEDDENANK